MPALKKVITDNDYVRSIIARQKELLRLTDAQIAKKIGITRPTLQSRLREPEDFSLGELRELITVLKLTQEDGLTILVGRRVQAMNEDEAFRKLMKKMISAVGAGVIAERRAEHELHG